MFPELLFRSSFFASCLIRSLSLLRPLSFDTAISVLPLVEEVRSAKLKLIVVQQRVLSAHKSYHS